MDPCTTRFRLREKRGFLVLMHWSSFWHPATWCNPLRTDAAAHADDQLSITTAGQACGITGSRLAGKIESGEKFPVLLAVSRFRSAVGHLGNPIHLIAYESSRFTIYCSQVMPSGLSARACHGPYGLFS